jgi:hypothetical protein
MNSLLLRNAVAGIQSDGFARAGKIFPRSISPMATAHCRSASREPSRQMSGYDPVRLFFLFLNIINAVFIHFIFTFSIYNISIVPIFNK